MANSKIRKSNLHTEVTTMISTMIGENAVDSADVTSIIDSSYIQAAADSDYIKTVQYLDNDKLVIGTDEDFELYHDGSNLFLYNDTGNNYFRSNRFAFSNTSGTLMADMYSGAQVALNYSGSEKFRTESTGAKVTGNLTLTSTDAGSSAGPELILYRNSSSPDDGDYIGQIQFKGRQDGPGDEIYAKVTGKISDASNGTEDGLIETAIKGNGSFTIVSRQRSNELQLINGVGLSVAGNTTLSGTLNNHTIPGGSGTFAITSDLYQDSDVGAYIAGNRTYGNITTTGYIAGPATMTIDPAAVGDNTGTVVIAGDLQVDGTTTTINSTTVTVDDLNLTLASGAVNAAAANGAGITVDGASATITYDATNDEWDFNKDINVTGTVTADGLTVDGQIQSNVTGGSLYTSTAGGIPRLFLGGGSGFGINRQSSGEDIFFGEPGDTGTWRVRGAGTISLGVGNSATSMVVQGNGGNIGIGTTTPFAKFHVRDTSWSSGSPYGTVQLIEGNNVNDNNWGHLVITDTTTTNGNGGSISFATGASGALNPFSGIKGVSEGSSWGGIGFYSRPQSGTATRRMTILSDGNVGIGTNSPDDKFHVEGTASNSVILANSTTAPTNSESLPPALEFQGRGWDTDYGSKLIRGKIEYFADYGDYGSGATQGSLRFSTQGAGGNSTAPDSLQLGMTLAAGSDAQPYPRLGIGMTDPKAKLHVRTSTVAAGSDLDEIAIIADTPFITGYQAQSASLISGFDSTIHGTAIGMAYENPGYALTFFTNNNTSGLPTERVRINDSGNVSIGAGASPSERIQVGGNIRAGNTGATTSFDGGGNDRYIGVSSLNGGDAMFIAHASGYGVAYFGYEPTDDKLIIACDNGGGNNKIDFSVNAGTNANGATDNLTGITPAMRITGAGNVFIGNTSNGYTFTSGEKRLSVGDGAEHAAVQVYSGSGNWGGLEFADDTTNGAGQGLIGYYHPSNYMQFNTSGAHRMRIDSNGYVSIGDGAPTSSYGLEIQKSNAGAGLYLHRTDTASMVGAGIYHAYQLTQTNGQSARLAEITATGVSNWGGELTFATKPANGTPNNSATVRMKIEAGGYVGIGANPDPSTLLDVEGDNGGNSGPGTSGMTGMSVGSGFIAFRNNGSSFNEVIRGESNCTGIYNYNKNDGVLIYTNNADGHATPSFHPAYHFGGYNNADMETFGRGWANGDPIFTMARPGSKSIGSGYGAKGVSNSSQFTSIVKTATKTEFRDNQGQHYFDSNVTAGQSITAESTTAGFHYRSGNSGNGYRSFVHHDGQIIFRDTNDYNHKMWYYDGVNIGTNQSHGHFRVWAENNTSRNNNTGGVTLRFSVDTPNGNIGVTEGGSQIYSGSDERLKTNVVDLPNQLDKINQLRPVSYDWKYTSEEEYIYGFLAQEVQAVDDTVVYDMGTTHYRIDKQYGEDLEPDGTIENTLAIYERQLIPMMVKAMQEMSDKIDALEARLSTLEG